MNGHQADLVFIFLLFVVLISHQRYVLQEEIQTGEFRFLTLFIAFIHKFLNTINQLLNVLKGDMSLIGPRPERPELAREFEERIPGFSRRLRVRAGLTGLAQVIQGYPRFSDGYRQKLAFDLVYIKRQSLALDAWIVLKTVGVVLSGSGAR